MPAATAAADRRRLWVSPEAPSETCLDRFLHHAKVLSVNGRSYRLRNQACKEKADK